MLVVEVKRIMIALLISFTISPIPNLLIQTLHLFYLFTVKPYKYECYSISSLVMQILVVVFYIFSSLAKLYFDFHEVTKTSKEIHSYILVKLVLFGFIVIFFLIVAGYETYDNVRSIFRLRNNFQN